MLISFSVENYRSIKEPAQFSMSAIKPYKEQDDQLIKKQLPGLKNVDYLRAAAIYGPNAAGKSTLWYALRQMKEIVIKSASTASSTQLPYCPFTLDEEMKKKPTTFAIVFTAGSDDTRFEYSFSYNTTTVLEEELLAFPKGYEQLWFKRTTVGGRTEIKDSEHLRIPKAYRPMLNDNMLLLSFLDDHPNTKTYNSVKAISGWFKDYLDLYTQAPDHAGDLPYSAEILKGTKGTRKQQEFILDLMKKADLGIMSAKVEEREIPEELLEQLSAFLEQFGDEEETKTTVDVVYFDHKIGDEEAFISYERESDGTKQLFNIAGHLSRTLEIGGLLFVDELDASLHPLIVREVVQTFLNPKTNPRNAQLVFTAHNPCLLENGLLRRDQIWFTEKDTLGGTQLYPLSDFSPRKDEAILSGYLSGKYSAIPVVPVCFGLSVSL